METPRSRNSTLLTLAVVLLAIPLVYRFLPGLLTPEEPTPHNVTICGFHPGVTRAQIESKFGSPHPGLDPDTWIWGLPSNGPEPEGPAKTFDCTHRLLTWTTTSDRIYLTGPQCECHGHTYTTDLFGNGSVTQGTLRTHFGPAQFTEGAMSYPNLQLSFYINDRDQFCPGSLRAACSTTLSWPILPPGDSLESSRTKPGAER